MRAGPQFPLSILWGPNGELRSAGSELVARGDAWSFLLYAFRTSTWEGHAISVGTAATGTSVLAPVSSLPCFVLQQFALSRLTVH